ncbi:MAG TPA: cell envelope integrity protein TolA [Candidatus Sulfotelmatobacter sp.]|nr:cell envelope integrity protein TolA [Candidatus Sulfotelmatobacter sp.]
MKLVGVLSTAVLSLSLGIGIPAYAQQDQHEQEENKDKPAQEKEKKAQPEKSAKPDEKNAQQEEKGAKPEEKNAQEQHAQQSKPEQKEEHASGGRIPADRFKANFGREHSFRVSEGDYRNHRFQYGGYWFGFASVWPSNWLYTQDVYVVEIDGVYYLCNASYPGVNLMLSVTM